MSVQILPPATRHAPGTFFRPNSWAQQRTIISSTPQLLYSGRYGSAKSRTLCEKADFRCRAYPGARVVIARKQRASMGDSTLPVLLEETITPSERAWGWRVSADGGSKLYYPNGSHILVVGLDNPGRLRSGRFDLALVDQAEELEEVEWNAVLGRLRHPHGPYRQLAGFCNPGSPSHFLFKRFRPDLGSHVEWTTEPTTLLSGEVVGPGYPLREVVLSGRTDNLENLGRDYEMIFASYSGGYYERYVLGRWVSFEGALFPTYDEQFHVIERPIIWHLWGGYPPPNWKRVRSVDFGYSAPFVCQWWAIDPHGTWYLYREVYRSHRLVAEHAKVLKHEETLELAALNRTLTAWNENKAVWPKKPLLKRLSFALSVADHADAEARAQLGNLGFSTSEAVKDRDAGYQTMYELMQPRTDPTTNIARARMYFIRDALCEKPDPFLANEGKPTCTWMEMPLLQFVPQSNSKKDRTASEDHVKGDDHGYDAGRYAVHSYRMNGSSDIILLK